MMMMMMMMMMVHISDSFYRGRYWTCMCLFLGWIWYRAC